MGLVTLKTRYGSKVVCISIESRELLLSAAGSRLFGSIDKWLLEMLFSVPKCLGLADLTSFMSVACDSLDRLVPRRYAPLFDHNITS